MPAQQPGDHSKMALNNHFQAYGWGAPHYKDAHDGRQHDGSWTSSVIVSGYKFEGSGPSKLKAQNAAAKSALQGLRIPH
ncbi:hypothetical protein SCHPADRAFT_940589 [Schizopora paradoxa]|uniref:DRBM domain-containing protein n=1 Tax=Schizopora paradoxa TaxID=27342 RepID=A0A0H2S8M6_9AGAM|nr:hypothetical protein SCHPADRAFT_940589 [Schizopora paradoxa]